MFGSLCILFNRIIKYIKDEAQNNPVKILYDTELGLGFGFNYLLDQGKVRRADTNFQDIYQIVIRKVHNKQGVEFQEPNSPIAIKVVKFNNFIIGIL